MAIMNHVNMSDIIAVAYFLSINLLAFVLYGVDKLKARKDRYRIPESTLLWMARLGGGAGSWLGIKAFHHKTKHTKFRILVPLWTVAWVAGIVYFVIKYYYLP